MLAAFHIGSYLAWRRLLAPLAFAVLLVAALFGAHTPCAGYDDDDPNRVGLVADFPRLGLNGLNVRRAEVRVSSAQVRPQAPGKPHREVTLAPRRWAHVVARARRELAALAPRAPPVLPPETPAPRGPPLLA